MLVGPGLFQIQWKQFKYSPPSTRTLNPGASSEGPKESSDCVLLVSLDVPSPWWGAPCVFCWLIGVGATWGYQRRLNNIEP
jgi:hypothetical protein